MKRYQGLIRIYQIHYQKISDRGQNWYLQKPIMDYDLTQIGIKLQNGMKVIQILL